MDKQFRVKLIVRRAPALAALGWLKQAWTIFVKAPLSWVLMFVTLGVMALLAQGYPPLTTIIGILLNPFLTAGVYKSAVSVQQQKTIQFTDLFSPLGEVECRAVFIRLAGLNMLASIPLSSLAVTLMQQQQENTLHMPLLFLFVVGFVLTWMIFAYAVAIAYFLKEQRLLAIMQASFVACWRNIVPLMIFLLLSLVLIMLTMPTYFIGLFVVVPVLNIAFFLSFNEFFALQVKTTDDAVLEV